MYLELDNVCIFAPNEDIHEEILEMQEEFGDNVTALITPDTYFDIMDSFGSDKVMHHNEQVYMNITRFENTKGIVDFMVIGDVDEN